MEKRRFLIDSFLIILLLIIISGVMYLIDPLRQYSHRRILKIFYTQERLLNPGLAKNEKYNSIILGSSMTRNFSTNQINKILGWNSIKLPMMSGTPYDHKRIFDIANKHKKIKNVIYGLDLQVFDRKEDEPYIRLEEYLYQDNILDDYKYLLNGEIMLSIVPKLLVSNIFGLKKEKLEKDTAYSWEKNEYVFSKEQALKAYPLDVKKENFNLEQAIKTYNKNLGNILKENQKINFYIFFPPYSILNYKLWEEKGILDDILKLKKYIINDIQDLENVFLFDFQIEDKITKNLDLYMDLNHYHPSINNLMIEKMSKMECLADINKTDIVLKEQLEK